MDSERLVGRQCCMAIGNGTYVGTVQRWRDGLASIRFDNGAHRVVTWGEAAAAANLSLNEKGSLKECWLAMAFDAHVLESAKWVAGLSDALECRELLDWIHEE